MVPYFKSQPHIFIGVLMAVIVYVLLGYSEVEVILAALLQGMARGMLVFCVVLAVTVFGTNMALSAQSILHRN